MTVIGLTGPSGSGKGKIAEILSEYGIQHINADSVYHNILIPPSPCLDELVETFGYKILNAGGQLDRRALGAIVFGDENKQKLERLNSITHKYVCARIRQIIRYFESMDRKACVIDAPLLLESGLDRDCDFVISVLADAELRSRRIAQRDDISLEDANLRIRSQKSDSFYIDGADIVIYNNGDEDQLRATLLDGLRNIDIGGAE